MRLPHQIALIFTCLFLFVFASVRANEIDRPILSEQQVDSVKRAIDQHYLRSEFKPLIKNLQLLQVYYQGINEEIKLIEISLKLADVNRAIKNFSEAIEICNQQLKLIPSSNQELIADVYALKGSIFYEIKEIDSSRNNLDNAIALYENLNEIKQANSMIIKGALYKNINLNHGKDILKKAIVVLQQNKDSAGLSLALYNLGNMFSETDSMIYYFNRSLEISNQLDITTYRIMAIHGLVVANERENRWKEAFEAVALRDEIQERKVSRSEFAEVDKMLEEIEHQRRRNEMQAMQEKIQLIDELNTRKNLFLTLSICVMILLGVFLGIIYRNNHRRKIDLKKLEKLNREVSEYSAKLSELNSTKDKILSIISHDLRSPFSQLITFLAFAQEDSIDPNDMAMINKEMLITSKNGLHMLDNLLYWANAQREGQQRVKSEFTAASVVQDVKEQLAYLAKNKNVKVKINCSLTLTLEADKILYEIVVRNLLSNAIKFSQPESNVEVLVDKKSGRIETVVRDYGIGMPESIVESLNMHKLDYKSLPGTKGEKGAGMGLYLSQDFAGQNEGQLFFEKMEEGTQVTFTLNQG